MNDFNKARYVYNIAVREVGGVMNDTRVCVCVHAIEWRVYMKLVIVYQLLSNYNQSIVNDTGREGRSNGVKQVSGWCEGVGEGGSYSPLLCSPFVLQCWRYLQRRRISEWCFRLLRPLFLHCGSLTDREGYYILTAYSWSTTGLMASQMQHNNTNVTTPMYLH